MLLLNFFKKRSKFERRIFQSSAKRIYIPFGIEFLPISTDISSIVLKVGTQTATYLSSLRFTSAQQLIWPDSSDPDSVKLQVIDSDGRTYTIKKFGQWALPQMLIERGQLHKTHSENRYIAIFDEGHHTFVIK